MTTKRSSIPMPMPPPDDQALRAIQHLKKCIEKDNKEATVPARVRLSEKDKDALKALLRKKPVVSSFDPHKNIETILEVQSKMEEKAMPRRELSDFYS